MHLMILATLKRNNWQVKFVGYSRVQVLWLPHSH